MAAPARGRGTAALFGFLLVAAGLIAGGVLYWQSRDRADVTITRFARAAAGCTTTLDFTSAGTYYVYQEEANPSAPVVAGCTPAGQTGQAFDFAITGPAEVVRQPDVSITYETLETRGLSIARIEVAEPGRYEIVVLGPDTNSVAAVGGDPQRAERQARRAAMITAAVGVVLGALLLALAGRRSRLAAGPSTPVGPGRAEPVGQPPGWPPEPPNVPQVPINPHHPERLAEPEPPLPPLPERTPGLTGPVLSPWAPPAPGSAPVDATQPSAAAAPRSPVIEPTLPDDDR